MILTRLVALSVAKAVTTNHGEKSMELIIEELSEGEFDINHCIQVLITLILNNILIYGTI